MAANGNVVGAKDDVPGTSPLGAYVLTAETFYKNWVMARDAAGLLVEPTAIRTLLPGGYVDRSLLVAAVGSDTDQANVETGFFSVPMLSTSVFAASDAPLPIYFENNREFAKSNSNRSVAGLFLFLDPARPTTHCIAWIGPEGAAIGKALERHIVAATRNVRGVVFNNQASLAAFTVASDDGITYIENDRVMLVGQTTAEQCGIYVVGVVAAGVAPLTRAADMPAGARIPNGVVVEVAAGTTYANSTWKATATTTGGWVVGTNDPVFYPKIYKQKVTLASGTYTIGAGSSATPDEPLFMLAGAVVSCSRAATGGTVTSTIQYNSVFGTRVAGKHGTAVAIILATVAAGTINTADNSDVDVLITNF